MSRAGDPDFDSSSSLRPRASSPGFDPLRQIPSVHEVLRSPEFEPLLQSHSRPVVTELVRAVLAEVRAAARRGAGGVPDVATLAERVGHRLAAADQPYVRPVINATGIILHTNLGRAPLAEPAVRALAAAAANYAVVDFDLPTGGRSSRSRAVRGLLAQLTGAESAVVVNNNAAATVLVLAALAGGRSVVVSRGQLVEIGGSFRLPEIMSTSGALLREVGTTNKTRLSDYAAAIDETTAALMRVHTSNYRITGFTAEVPIGELAELAHARGVLAIDDIGSGALVDFRRFGLEGEPLARASLAAGADVVLFSGDKLLGGPQAGIILGRAAPIARIERHPLMRGFRVDKLILSALEATLRLYRDPATALATVPALVMVRTPLADLRRRGTALVASLQRLPGLASIDLAEDVAYLGGGSLPTQGLPTMVLRLTARGLGEDAFARRLRTGDPPVIPRIAHGAVVLDLRTIQPSQTADLITALDQALGPGGKNHGEEGFTAEAAEIAEEN